MADYSLGAGCAIDLENPLSAEDVPHILQPYLRQCVSWEMAAVFVAPEECDIRRTLDPILWLSIVSYYSSEKHSGATLTTKLKSLNSEYAGFG